MFLLMDRLLSRPMLNDNLQLYKSTISNTPMVSFLVLNQLFQTTASRQKICYQQFFWWNFMLR